MEKYKLVLLEGISPDCNDIGATLTLNIQSIDRTMASRLAQKLSEKLDLSIDSLTLYTSDEN
jgi:hypothetical protein